MILKNMKGLSKNIIKIPLILPKITFSHQRSNLSKNSFSFHIVFEIWDFLLHRNCKCLKTVMPELVSWIHIPTLWNNSQLLYFSINQIRFNHPPNQWENEKYKPIMFYFIRENGRITSNHQQQQRTALYNAKNFSYTTKHLGKESPINVDWLKARLVVISGTTSNLFNTWKFLSFKW